jgi:hypothetical protein
MLMTVFDYVKTYGTYQKEVYVTTVKTSIDLFKTYGEHQKDTFEGAVKKIIELVKKVPFRTFTTTLLTILLFLMLLSFLVLAKNYLHRIKLLRPAVRLDYPVVCEVDDPVSILSKRIEKVDSTPAPSFRVISSTPKPLPSPLPLPKKVIRIAEQKPVAFAGEIKKVKPAYNQPISKYNNLTSKQKLKPKTKSDLDAQLEEINKRLSQL